MKYGSKTWILFLTGFISIFPLFQLFINKSDDSSQEIFDVVLNSSEHGQTAIEILEQRTMKIRQICETRRYSEDDTPIHEDTERSSLHHYKPLEMFLCMY